MTREETINMVVAGMLAARKSKTPLSTIMSSPHYANLPFDERKEALREYLEQSNGDNLAERGFQEKSKSFFTGAGKALTNNLVTLGVGAYGVLSPLLSKRGLKRGIKSFYADGDTLATLGVVSGMVGAAGGVMKVNQDNANYDRDLARRDAILNAIKNNDDGSLYGTMLTNVAPAKNNAVLNSALNSVGKGMMKAYPRMMAESVDAYDIRHADDHEIRLTPEAEDYLNEINS